MKRCLMILLVLCLLIPCIAGVTSFTAEGAANDRPFNMLIDNAHATNGKYSNVYKLTALTVKMTVNEEDGSKSASIAYGGKTGMEAVYALKKAMAELPEGARYVRIPIQEALLAVAEDIVYFQPAVEPLKAAFENFFMAYEQAGGKLVEDVALFDIYRGPQVGDNKKSVSMRVTLRAADRTLTVEEADKVAAKILAAMEKQLGITLRS